VEIRDVQLKQVRFSAVHLSARQLLWNEITFEESWWISLTEVSEALLLLSVYTDTNNPDKKSLVAFDFYTRNIVWWRNNFSISGISEYEVEGTDTSLGPKNLVLSLKDGQPSTNHSIVPLVQNLSIYKPLQYHEQSLHFETVKSFIAEKFHISALFVIEYLEFDSFIFASVYVQENGLVNYLLVMNQEGELVLKQTIGEQLKGIGLDTFFIVSGYLIFVKNRSELVSYKIV
jgi:hypothetical protein